MDSLTAHFLARALAERWRGRRVSAVRFDRDEPAVILHIDGSAPVRFPLAGGGPAAAEVSEAPADSLQLEGWHVTDVSAPEDERRLRIELDRRGKFRGSPARRATLDVSFVPTARGARLGGDAGSARIGGRMPVTATPRPLLIEDAVVRAVAEGDRKALLAGRWMSPAAIEWIGADKREAAARYRELVELGDAPPPFVGALIAPAGMAAPSARPAPAIDDKRARAIARMERELAEAGGAPRSRAAAQILFSSADAPAPREVALPDGPFAVEPRAGERAVQAAERLLAAARSMERALASLPERIAALRSAPPARPPAPPAKPVRARAPRAARPYREYVSSGGLEIWVGRGAESNDELTFRLADPDDVWMHARDVAGAHVVLRWTRPEPPPALDLAEAAAIAAWHSKGRGSTLTPVDWTRRKHVRKPRGGPAGLVLVDRVKTVNARPSAKLERSLRREE